jgi:hypothetical protein
LSSWARRASDSGSTVSTTGFSFPASTSFAISDNCEELGWAEKKAERTPCLAASSQGSAGTFNLQSTELYNPSTGKWTLKGNTFQSGNRGFSVTMLNTGKVLIAGGIVGVYPHTFVTAAAELYDPSTGTSASTGSLNTARETHGDAAPEPSGARHWR